MAFDTVRVKRVRADEEDSFLDYEGKATLFEDDEVDPEEAEEGPEDQETEEVDDGI